MFRSYVVILGLLTVTSAHASEAAVKLHDLWNEKAYECRGNSMSQDTAWTCGESDAYLDALHIIGACKNADKDGGCELKD